MLNLLNFKKSMLIAGTAVVLLAVSGGIWAYANPYTYVSMDVNPSIEFTVNRFNRVIGVKAVNDDGTEILQELSASDITNASIKNAIIGVLEQIIKEGYFEGDGKGGIVIATTGQNLKFAGDLAKELQQIIELFTVENGDKVEVDSFSVDQESADEALKMGVTPGKLKLVRILEEAAKGITVINEEEWLSKPVKEIIAAIGLYINAIDTNVINDVTSEGIREEALLFDEQSEDADADIDEDQDDDGDRSDDADKDEDQDDDEDQDVDQDDDEDQDVDRDNDADKDEDQDDDEDQNKNRNDYIDQNKDRDDDSDEDEDQNDDADEDQNHDSDGDEDQNDDADEDEDQNDDADEDEDQNDDADEDEDQNDDNNKDKYRIKSNYTKYNKDKYRIKSGNTKYYKDEDQDNNRYTNKDDDNDDSDGDQDED